MTSPTTVPKNQVAYVTDDNGPLCGTVLAYADYRSVLLVIMSPKALVFAHLSIFEQTKEDIMDHVCCLVSKITKKTPHCLLHRSTYVFYPYPDPSHVTNMLSELDRELIMVGLPSPKRTSFTTCPTDNALPFCVSVVYNDSPLQHPRVRHGRAGQLGQDVTQLTASAHFWARIDGLANYHQIAAQLTETSIMADEIVLLSNTLPPGDTWILCRSRGQPCGWIKKESRSGQENLRVSVQERRHKLVGWSLLPSSQDMVAAGDGDTTAYAARVKALERACGSYCT